MYVCVRACLYAIVSTDRQDAALNEDAGAPAAAVPAPAVSHWASVVAQAAAKAETQDASRKQDAIHPAKPSAPAEQDAPSRPPKLQSRVPGLDKDKVTTAAPAPAAKSVAVVVTAAAARAVPG